MTPSHTTADAVTQSYDLRQDLVYYSNYIYNCTTTVIINISLQNLDIVVFSQTTLLGLYKSNELYNFLQHTNDIFIIYH